MGRSRLEMRKMAEAAEKMDAAETKAGTKKKKKRATKKRASSRSKRKDTPVRKRLVWAIFSGSMKEEARFPYEQRSEAEEKLEQLRSKSKKLYFIQPLKEAIPEAEAEPAEAES